MERTGKREPNLKVRAMKALVTSLWREVEAGIWGTVRDLEAKTSSVSRESKETCEAMGRVMERPEDLVRPWLSYWLSLPLIGKSAWLI